MLPARDGGGDPSNEIPAIISILRHLATSFAPLGHDDCNTHSSTQGCGTILPTDRANAHDHPCEELLLQGCLKTAFATTHAAGVSKWTKGRTTPFSQ